MSLFGPVFHKELLELSRRRSTFFLRVLAGFALLFVFLVFGELHARPHLSMSITKLQAAIAQEVFENWVWYQWWIVIGVMPLLTCGLVATERETGSLPLLFTTHLTNREIILGKLASRLVTVFLLCFSALPVLVLLGLLGGIDLDRLFRIYLMTFAAAALAASVGVYLSTTAKRPWVAAIQTYATLGVLWGVVPWGSIFGYVVYGSIRGAPRVGPPGQDLMPFLMIAAPYLPIYFFVEQRAMMFFARMLDWEHVLAYVGAWLGLSAIFLFLAMRALRKDLKASLFSRVVGGIAGAVFRPFKRAATKKFGIESALFWRMRFAGFKIFEGNPIVWRDRRADVYDPDGNVLRMQMFVWIFAVPLCLLFTAMGHRGGEQFGWLISIEVALLHVMLAVVGASAISRERQRGSLDVLLLSKMPSWSIIVGTVQGVFWTCTPTLILIGGTMALQIWGEGWVNGYGYSRFRLEFAALTVCYSLFISTASVFISSSAAKPNHAIAASVVVGLALWFFPMPVNSAWMILEGQFFRQTPLVPIFVIGYVVLLVGALLIAARLLAKDKPFPAAVVFVLTIPMLLFFFAPNYGRSSNVTLFLRWVLALKDERRHLSGQRPEETFDLMTTSSAVLLCSLLALLALVYWKGDRFFGRMQTRQRPGAKPPFVGRNTPARSSHVPMPTNAPA
jgi:ABC-type transport system involved in multi-copper enzyme maturation permease subunit